MKPRNLTNRLQMTLHLSSSIIKRKPKFISFSIVFQHRRFNCLGKIWRWPIAVSSSHKITLLIRISWLPATTLRSTSLTSKRPTHVLWLVLFFF